MQRKIKLMSSNEPIESTLDHIVTDFINLRSWGSKPTPTPSDNQRKEGGVESNEELCMEEEEDTNHFLSVFLLISAAIAFAIMWQTFLNNWGCSWVQCAAAAHVFFEHFFIIFLSLGFSLSTGRVDDASSPHLYCINFRYLLKNKYICMVPT